MSDDSQGIIHGASEGGVAATHPAREPFQFLVGPSTSSEFNLARLQLIPIACWKIEDIRFAFDSSFVTPDVVGEIKLLQALREQHKKLNNPSGKVQYPPLSVFGHADPVGPAVDPDGYNKALSGRRATAIYALLNVNSNPDTAVNLWRQISATEHWGAEQRKAMQANVPAGTSDGDLFKVYMQKLCPADFKLTPQDFLAQGADSKGKGDYQGCSSFNPLLIFSQKAENQYERAEQSKDQSGLLVRNTANAPNRRVMVLLFRPGSVVVPAKWPCPAATDDKAGCIKRFWSNGDKRRHTRLLDADRKFTDTQDTFACRFYQRVSSNSPCQQTLETVRIRLFDRLAHAIPGASFVVVSGGIQPQPGTADSNGDITIHNVTVPSTCVVRWSRPQELRSVPPGPPTDITPFEASLRDDGFSDEEISDLQNPPPAPDESKFEFEREVFIKLADVEGPVVVTVDSDGDVADQRRLHNLGYSAEPEIAANLAAFQKDCEGASSNQITDIRAELKKRHLNCNPPPRVTIA